MKLIYTTLNNNDEARRIGKLLLESRLANCVNFFPITCMYNYPEPLTSQEPVITEELEVVLIIKTKDNKFDEVVKSIQSEITYTNFIGELQVTNVSDAFSLWLNAVVK